MNAEYAGRDNLEAMLEARRYNEHLLSMVRNVLHGGEVIVDFGAGIGTFARALAAEGHSVRCVEPDPAQSALIRDAGLTAQPSLQSLPAASADVIYTFNVLEHIQNDGDTMRELYGAIKPGGLLVVYVPAFPLLFSSMDRMVGHFRRYKRGDLRSKLEAAGFEVETVRYVDSVGFAVTLLYRLLGNDDGKIDASAVAIYDRWIFPVSVVADRVLSSFVGKNVMAIARRPRTD